MLQHVIHNADVFTRDTQYLQDSILTNTLICSFYQ